MRPALLYCRRIPTRRVGPISSLWSRSIHAKARFGVAWLSALEPFSRLLLFSDGAYEIGRADGHTMAIEELIEQLARQTAADQDDLDTVVGFLRQQTATGQFEDDLSLLRIDFGV